MHCIAQQNIDKKEEFMKINWFPGHMHKALKDIENQLKKVDVCVYVLDARIPLSSLNPTLSKIAEGKPILFLINKIDLADEKRVKELLPNFVGENKDFLLFNSTSFKSELVLAKIKKLAKAKIEKYLKKGVKPTIRVMVVGVPNSGKSSLVNNLCKKAKTITGNRAGVTKSGQWLNVGDGIEIYDTPGTLYPNIDDQEVAKKLAFVGSVRDEVLEFVSLAEELFALLQEKYSSLISKRYPNCQSVEDIAKLRKYVTNGGEIDLERASYSFVDDFRKGRIGKITLD